MKDAELVALAPLVLGWGENKGDVVWTRHSPVVSSLRIKGYS